MPTTTSTALRVTLVVSLVLLIVFGAVLAALFSSVPQSPTRPSPRPPGKFEHKGTPLRLHAYVPGASLRLRK